VLTLALYFLSHVGWPEGLSGRLDAVSLTLFAAAAVALMHYKRSVIEVIVASAMVGWALSW
jgi:chromate transporter